MYLNRDQMEAIANVLRKNNNYICTQASKFAEITAMADRIYEFEQKSDWPHKRTKQKIFEDCENIVIEHALAWAVRGEKNPHDFDHTKPDTYYWDVRAVSTKKGNEVKFECKRWKRSDASNFFSYSKTGLKTFLRHKDKLDYVVIARLHKDEKDYKVEFKMIADASTFDLFLKPSKYNDWEVFYDHHRAKEFSVII